VSLRTALQGVGVQPTTHPGLWLDKYARAENGRLEAPQKARTIREAAGVKVRDGYRRAFERREQSFTAAGCLCFDVEAEGRIAIGLGAKGVLENGLTLEHTWGVPILPGSALKGLAAAAARKLVGPGSPDWSANGASYRELFGTTELSGCVDFHDAWWRPVDGRSGIDPDVMTVHHAEYYGGENNPPSDFDSPTPIPFCTARGTFLVALDGDRTWCEAARQLLVLGLEHLGIGAKTNAGYGRMSFVRFVETEAARAEREARERAERERETVRRSARNLPQQLQGPQNMGQVLKKLADFREAGLPADEVNEVARDLFAKFSKAWMDWRAKNNRTEAERSLYDALIAPVEHQARQAAPATTAPQVDRPAAEAVLTTREVRAWAEADKKASNRFELHVEGASKPFKLHAIEMDKELLAALKQATKAAPLVCVGHFKGEKLKRLTGLTGKG
jgi:CRISPR-associated protein Cmr6